MQQTVDSGSHEQVLTTAHVLDEGLPVLLVTRSDDGDLQMLDGVRTPSVAAGRLVCLHHLLERDPSLRPISQDLHRGTRAQRTAPGAAWSVRREEPPAPWRLDEALPELSARLRHLPLRSCELFAIDLALRCVAQAAWPPLSALAEHVRHSPTGDTPGRNRIGDIVEQLEARDPAPGSEDFRHARAALALWFALSDDPYEAAAETAFEALHFGVPERDLDAAAMAAEG